MRRPQLIWMIIVALVTLSLAWVLWSHLDTYQTSDHQVVLAREGQRRLFELVIILQDTENGARGYLLTSEERLRGIHQNASRDLDVRMAVAESALNAVQMGDAFAPVKDLMMERKRILEQVVELKAAGKTDEAMALFMSDHAVPTGVALRGAVLTLLGRVDDVLQARLTTCRQSTDKMVRWVAGGVAALLASSMSMILLMWRDRIRQRRSAAVIAEARDAALAGTRARDEFLDVLSHELRTPLTPAILAASHLEKTGGLDGERREQVTMIRRQLELEARLIDDLLDVSRILRGDVVLRTTPVSIHALLQHVVSALQEEIDARSISLTRSLDANSDRVLGNESRLNQAFWHLLNNAIKFSPVGGTVRIHTTSSDGVIAVKVIDSGVGFSADQSKTLFQPFWQADSSRTRRFGGLGLGLPIVRSVCEMHLGSIAAYSAGPNQGASFTVTLPLAETPQPAH